MKYQTRAIYFDGESSKPRSIDLVLNKDLKIVSSDTVLFSQNSWPLNQLQLQFREDAILLQPKGQGVAYLKIEEDFFVNTHGEFLQSSVHQNLYSKLVSLNWGVHVTLAVALLGLIVGGYLFVVPWVAERAVNIIPVSYDTKIGQTFVDQFAVFENIDSSSTYILNTFADELDLSNQKPLNFTVIQSNLVNAFALPDGSIFIYSGLLKKMEDYSELVALIGHEASHVNHRHSMKMLCRDLSGYIFISVLLGDINAVTATIANNLHSLNSLTYSRKFEREADIEGLKIMKNNGIDIQGMHTLFSRLQRESEQNLPELFSTHPLTKSRMEYICEEIDQTTTEHKINPTLYKLFDELLKSLSAEY